MAEEVNDSSAADPPPNKKFKEQTVAAEETPVDPKPEIVINYTVNVESSNFKELLKTDFFIDNTLLIKQFFQYDHLLINAPSKFGKSTNLNMLKTFLELHVDENGEPIRSLDCDTFNGLNISAYPEFVEEHLGQHPIIFVNLAFDDVIINFESILNSLRTIVHNSFCEHKYLMNSKNITDHEKVKFGLYCDPVKYKKFDEDDIANGLEDLALYLFKHFNRKAYVLIDNYDTATRRLMFEKHVYLNDVHELVNGMVSSLTQYNDKYVERSFITGQSSVGIYNLNNIQEFGHFSDEFCIYYGITDEELCKIFTRLGIPESETTQAIKWYGGYSNSSGNIKLSSIFSIANYLKKREFRCFWKVPEYIKNIEELFVADNVKGRIDQLIRGHSSNSQFIKRLHFDHIQCLKKLVMYSQRIQDSHVLLFLQFLFEMGYLTPVDNINKTEQIHDPKKVWIKIPNDEIKNEIKNSLREDAVLGDASPLDNIIRFTFCYCR